MIRATLLISAALMCASVAYAGDSEVTLTGQKGTVMVNSGKQFVSAKAGQSLKQGDRVMVMEGGTATITYANGCIANVKSGSMVDINTAKCGKSARKVGPMYAEAVGDTAAHEASEVQWVWIAGVLTAVIVATVVVNNNNKADGVSLP